MPQQGLRRTKRQPFDKDMLSPLDIFVAVYKCCDPMLQRLLVRKMFLCKLAVPFVYYKNDHSLVTVDNWPMISLSLNNDAAMAGLRNVLTMETCVFSFARLGRPNFSKSQVLNSLLSAHENIKSVFFNRECQGGTIKRSLSQGVTEIFWLSLQGRKNTFNTPVTFLNVRGSLKDYKNESFFSLINSVSDCVVVITETNFIQNHLSENLKLLQKLPSLLLIMTGDTTVLSEEVIDAFDKFTIYPVEQEQTMNDVCLLIENYLQRIQHRGKFSLQTRLKSLPNIMLTDSHSDIKDSEVISSAIFRQMKINTKVSANDFVEWKTCLTESSCNLTQEIARLTSQMEKSCETSLIENIHQELIKFRKLQSRNVSDTIILFVSKMICHKQIRMIIIQWLQCCIEKEIKSDLPNLKQLKFNLQELLRRSDTQGSKPPDLESEIQILNDKIENATFRIEYFFREIGHICDSAIEFKSDNLHVGLPNISKIAEMVADLIGDGMSFELIDGDTSYLPKNWVKLVFENLSKTLNNPKMSVVSVLGVQGSGKSTLLNTMFGLDMAAGTGKTTKGVHLRLLTLDKCTSDHCHFSHLLILDTEGLRSPDITDKSVLQKRDNQLATFVTALGDITLVNNKGENYETMKDTLEIVIHAFLRLKANINALSIDQTCMFLHHNVTEEHARESMRDGFEGLVKFLDTVTEECAKSEGMMHLRHFNDVINFDISKNVFTFPNLWDGDPPMNSVSRCYTRKVLEVKKRIFETLSNDCKTYFQNIGDFSMRVNDIWKGVLSEKFVFCFRNNLEIKAYFCIERELDILLWSFEVFFRETILATSRKYFGTCDDSKDLDKTESSVIQKVVSLLNSKQMEVIQSSEKIFEDSDYDDIVIKWKKDRVDQIKVKFSQMIRNVPTEIAKYKNEKLLKLSTKITQQEKDDVREKSVEVAEMYKKSGSSPDNIDQLFEKLVWQPHCSLILKKHSETYTKDLKTVFERRLFEEFGKCMLNWQWEGKLSPDKTLNTLCESTKRLKFKKDIRSSNLVKIPLVASPPNYTPMIELFFESSEKLVSGITSVDEEIQEHDIACFLKDLNEPFDKLKGILENSEWTVRPALKGKLYVHVCEFACVKFEEHNIDYQLRHGIQQQLSDFRGILKLEFDSALKGRKEEAKIASQFMEVFKDIIRERVMSELCTELVRLLKYDLPTLKCEIIRKVCIDLATEDNFENYLRYLLNAKSYASDWFTDETKKILFMQKKYADTANDLIDSKYRLLKKAIMDCKAHFCKDFRVSDWFEKLKLLLPNDYINTSNFNLLDMTDVLPDIECFSNCFTNNDEESCQLKNEFLDLASNDHKEKRVLAFINKHLFERSWGCNENCPFCQEPCVKAEAHVGDHICIQHRPVCCQGVRERRSQEASVTACNYNIQNDLAYSCSVIRRKCNCGTNDFHDYKKYKVHYPNWDIVPSSSMYDTSLFWIRFVGKYKKELGTHYGYKVNKVHDNWAEINEKDAIDSLEKYYW